VLKSFVAWEPPGDSTDYEGIHILNLSTGADQRILRASWRIDDLAWSPDGSRLAYVTGNSRKIGVIATDGSSGPTVVDTTIGTASSPTRSPDGKRLCVCHPPSHPRPSASTP
jgi:Tol biopolymer transport system component